MAGLKAVHGRFRGLCPAMTDLTAPRYAIYFVPAPDTELYRFGAAVLGYDAYTGASLAHPPDLASSFMPWSALTAEPRTYGFHATLKAPFRLRPGCELAELREELRSFATACATAPAVDPMVGLIAGFVAIVERSPSSSLARLAADCAADCVTAFDRFRSPLTAQERNKRLAAGLEPRQIDYLERWGYPYVLDQFRFHMTLTASLAPDRRAAVHAHLADAFTRRLGPAPIRIDRLALCQQAHPSACFQVLDSVPIGPQSLP